MLLKTAIRSVWHEREKLAGAVVGVALGVFLVVFQWGIYAGYKRDTTGVLDAFDADVWIIPKNQTTFDGFSHMDDLPYWQAKEVEGVEDAARIAWGDASWRLPGSGGKDFIQVLGIDFESTIAAHFDGPGDDLASLVRPDGHVLIGAKDRNKLGIDEHPEGPFEIVGKKAIVMGFVEEIHLFSTAGFVLTSLDNARVYLRLPNSHVNYIVCKCEPGADVAKVVERLQKVIPEHDVLTTKEFRAICAQYWETSSGIGPVILMSAGLGVVVGLLVVTMTFYIATIERIPMYACLKALGGATSEIALIVGCQVIAVFLLGAAIAGIALYGAVIAFQESAISVLITPQLVVAGLATMLACSVFGAVLSIRTLFSVDPGEAFRT